MPPEPTASSSPTGGSIFYPITYYCIGCHLRHYPLKLKKATGLLLLTAVVVIGGSYNYFRSYGGVYLSGTWQGWGSVINMTTAVLVFHLLTALDYSNMPTFLTKCFARMSDWSLGAYLVSWIFDNLYYDFLNARVPVVHDRLNYMPVMVFAVYFSALGLSAIIHGVYTLTFGRLLKRMRQTVSP